MTKKKLVIFSCPTQWQENEKMKKNFLSFLILIIYQFCSKFIADYEFAIKKELFCYFDDAFLILIFFLKR
jgi:hypothetical protein